MVELAPEPFDDARGCPVQLVVRITGLAGVCCGGLLLVQHAVQDGQQPVLECTVIVIGHKQVADAVEAAGPQIGPDCCERSQVRRGQTLDQVLFDPARRGDDGGDVTVLDEEPQGLPQARGDEVGGVAQEDGGAGTGGRIAIEALQDGELRVVEGL